MGRMSDLDIALHEGVEEETEAELLKGIGIRFRVTRAVSKQTGKNLKPDRPMSMTGRNGQFSFPSRSRRVAPAEYLLRIPDPIKKIPDLIKRSPDLIKQIPPVREVRGQAVPGKISGSP